MKYEEKKFNIGKLEGISEKTITEHLKLYAGYVKNLNTIHEIVENQDNPEYARREAYRRQGFEFGGMRNHEYYFSYFEGGAKTISESSALYKKIVEQIGSFDLFLKVFKGLTSTRGPGWAMLGYDKQTDKLIQYWVDEQQIGHLPGISPIIALDLWEHSYYLDYTPAEKGKYVDAFFTNLNWSVVESLFENAK
jgi:superoxide dismutase, Fe-Mn family